MNTSAVFSRRSLLVIVVFMGILLLCLDAGLYLGVERLLIVLAPGGVDPTAETVADTVFVMKGFLERFLALYLPLSAAGMAAVGLLLWLVVKMSVSSLFAEQAVEKQDLKRDGDDRKDVAEQRMEQERKRRLFLHFLSILQREGRLLDFFAEDLAAYDDEQIGAAVRSIHEDCKKTVEKYLSPKPVIDREEGGDVEVPAGFDPDAIKLTGNVTGKPPFKGVLRHRGWKAGKKEIPKLSDVLDSGIISPAEVELQ
ncbi:MAG: DUF2760 domain-containing protein [Pseudomonadota bacterium]